MTRSLLHHLLYGAAARAPDAPAFIEPKRTLSYGELTTMSGRVSAALLAAGIQRGECVGLWSEKTSWAVAAMYGVSRRGAAYAPIDPTVPPARAALILQRLGARALVATSDRVALIEELKRKGELPALRFLVLIGGGASSGVMPPESRAGLIHLEAAAQDPAPTETDARAHDRDLAYLLHTSGSTGVPKGVAITHDNAMAFIVPAADYFQISEADRLACQAPLHFDLSVFDLFCAALRGAAVVCFPEYFSAFPKKMAQSIDVHRVTIWNSVVSALGLLVDKGFASGEHHGQTLRAVIFSGERMPIPLLARIRTKLPGAALYNVYGQTEANSSLVHRVEGIPTSADASLPLGEPLPNFDVFLIDERGEVLREPEATGELCVRAATVASGGYFRAPELSAEKFILDPDLPDSGQRVYRTGDLVKRSAAGLEFVGRRDNMIKTRGYRVELSEIERALEAVTGVVEVAVVARPSPEIGHSLHAFVQASEAVTAEALEAELRRKLPGYMVPASIDVRAELPRTATGKIDRRSLTPDLPAAPGAGT